MSRIKDWLAESHDLAFAILLAMIVYGYFAVTNEFFATHRTTFAIMERFAVLGLVGLALTLCIIAGEIDLSIGSNAALSAVIVVRFTDSLGAETALLIAVGVATLIGVIQGYFIAYLRIRAIVLTVGTLMLLRGVALFVAQEKTVMLTDFTIPDFIATKVLGYFSPASLLVVAMFVVVGLFMTFTRYGREIYAIGGARKEALAAGINLQRPMIIVFAISGFCAGLGGCIIGLRSGTAQALGLQYLLLAGTVAAFIGGVSILGGRGGVVGAAIGTLTVNFLNTGLVFNVTPAFMVQLYLGVLLMIVIMFQTGSRMFDDHQRRRQILSDVDGRRDQLLRRRAAALHSGQGGGGPGAG
ncbi:MAG: ABC transporter permease [Rhodobacteraceae bacterium]|nr:ABC transporter permease [Paracoccaceae bacterium]